MAHSDNSKPTAKPVQRRLPLLTTAARIHATSFFLWFGLEAAAASQYSPVYSYITNPISDLGIPYVFKDAKHGNRVPESIRASLMNVNFYTVAGLYRLGQLCMLYAASTEVALDHTRMWTTTRNIRAGLSILFLVGMSIAGAVHAGPREVADGTIAIHFTGASITLFGQNCNLILAAFLAYPIPNQARKHYRAISFLLGAVGIIVGLCIEVASKFSYTGITERINVYCILIWGLITSVTIWAQHAGSDRISGKKRA